MIKFFRKIRPKLLTENNFSKYLLYAIGEIIIVVIGILIALQINNWNENQKNRKQEFNFVVEINREFKENKIDFEKIVLQHKNVLENCESLINLFPISLENTSFDTISKLVEGTWLYSQFNPSQNAINSLVELPSFQNMKNKELKDELSSWKVVLDNFKKKKIMQLSLR